MPAAVINEAILNEHATVTLLSDDEQDAVIEARRSGLAALTQEGTTELACFRWMSPTSFRVLWPDVGREGTMNVWLVGCGIPRRTSCANCAARTS